MKIKIIDGTADGDFTVGNVYKVSKVQNMVVWAYDNNEEIEPVYYYEYVWIEK